jgi:hypothetical protein
MLPPRASFNVLLLWLIDRNLVSLVEKCLLVGWNAGRRKLVVHIDNAPGHNSKMTQSLFKHNSLKRLPHPLYFPDISLSDFYLFGKVKSALSGGASPMRSTFLKRSLRI